MANRPKQYGGMSRGNDREREEQGRQESQGSREGAQAPRRARPRRASESEIWENEASPGSQDRDIDELDELDEQARSKRADRTR